MTHLKEDMDYIEYIQLSSDIDYIIDRYADSMCNWESTTCQLEKYHKFYDDAKKEIKDFIKQCIINDRKERVE